MYFRSVGARVTIFIYFFIVCGVIANAQVKSVSLEPNMGSYAKASSFYSSAKYDSALYYFKQAAEDYEKLGQFDNLAWACMRVGRTYRVFGKDDDAMTFYKKALTVSNTHFPNSYLTVLSLIRLSDCERATFDYTSAEEHINQAIEKSIRNLGMADSLTGEAYLTQGRIYIGTKNFEQAVRSLMSSATVFEAIGERSIGDLATTVLFLGEAQLALNRLADTEKSFLRALSLMKKAFGNEHRNTVAVLGNLSRLYLNQGNYDLAFQYARESIQIYKRIDKVGLALSGGYTNLAALYYQTDLIDSAIHYTNLAIQKREEVYGKYNMNLLSNYSNLGTLYAVKLDFANSDRFYNMALSTISQHSSDAKNDFADLVYKISQIHFEFKQFDKSIKFSKEGLFVTQRSYKDNKHLAKIQFFLLSNIATCYINLGADTLAEKYIKQALETEPYLGEDRSYEHTNAYLLIARYFRNNAKDLDRAKRYLDLAERIMNEQFGNQNHTQKQPLFIAKSHYFADRKNFEMANYFADQALQALMMNPFSRLTKAYDMRIGSNLGNTHFYIQILQLKTETYLKAYNFDKQSKHLEKALESLNKVDDVINALRKNFNSTISLKALNFAVLEHYRLMVEVNVLLYEITKKDSYYYTAFKASEASRSFDLLQNLIKLKNHSGVGNNLLLAEQRLIARGQFLGANIEQETNKEKVQYLKTQLYKLEDALESLRQKIYKENIQNESFKEVISFVDVSQLKELLSKENRALLEFFIAEEDVYVFKVTNKTNHVYKIPVNQLETDVALLNKAILESNYKKFTQKAYAVYNQLLKPALNNISEGSLTIVPHQYLFNLPFETLITKQPKAQDSYANLEYLTYKYAFTHQFSAAAWLQNKSKTSALSDTLIYLGIAPDFIGNTKFAELPDAVLEVKQLALLTKGKYFNKQSFIKEELIYEMHKANIVHFATHIVNNSSNVALGKLMLGNDQYFEGHEVINMNIPASLLTLNACNSGSGALDMVEGTMSFARNFYFAGVPSILMSSWQVSDAQGRSIVADFHKNLALGMAKDQALTLAKRNYLNNQDNLGANPLFWAGFSLIGDVAPLVKEPMEIVSAQPIVYEYANVEPVQYQNSPDYLLFAFLGLGAFVLMFFTRKLPFKGF